MEIRRCSNLQELSRAAAEFISEYAQECVTERNIFSLVLSGGDTPKMLYEYLAQTPFSYEMPWSRTHLFWGDERCVPDDNPASNYFMAHQALIPKVNIPSDNIHRIPAEVKSPMNAAKDYEKILREFFTSKTDFLSSSAEEELFPSFDLILLGMGEDGHIASLFPRNPILEEKKLWVEAVCAPIGTSPRERITLTLPVINRAACVIFLVAGSAKKKVLQTIMDDPEDTSYPAARVHPAGRLICFTDIMTT
jgi:6-phosphogluconolactonase